MRLQPPQHEQRLQQQDQKQQQDKKHTEEPKHVHQPEEKETTQQPPKHEHAKSRKRQDCKIIRVTIHFDMNTAYRSTSLRAENPGSTLYWSILIGW